jgi:integrase
MHKMTQPKVYEFKGKLYVAYTLNGKRQRKSIHMDDTKKNRHIANTEIIPKMILKANSGEHWNENKIPTLHEYQKISFDCHKNERRVTTNTDYFNTYMRHIDPYFGNWKIDTIDVRDIDRWKNTLVELGLSASRINDIKTILSTIFKDALIDKLITRNPVPLSKAISKIHKDDINPFTLDEVKTIVNVANGQTKNFIAMSFATGLRTGEMIGLKWSDIDFVSKKVTVKRTIGRGIEGPPKTETSKRTVILSKLALIHLKEQFEITGQQNSYVFLNERNTHYFDAKNTLRQWKKVLIDAKIEYRSQYQTRHTFCSLSILSGKKLTFVSKQMGHKNSNITLERYAKYIPSDDDENSIFDDLA